MQNIDFAAGTRPDRTAIRIAGPDARHFLQNLLTADIEHLAGGRATYAALLSPQGKILSDLFVTAQDDGFLLDCAIAQKADLLRKLALYRLRAKVTIDELADTAIMVSPAAIANGWRDPRLEAMGWRALARPGGAASTGYDAARISAGLADSVADIGSNQLFPHEANLDQLGGVSFTKGCYVGQEVVSRMEHRGTARSRILPLVLGGPAPPSGSDIRSGDRMIGTLLSSAGMQGLGLIRLDRLAEATTPLLTDAVTVRVQKPAWARYDVPGAEVMS
ncbi:MAG: folate-binding protein YgfZ [Hyphomicrobiales bacterium]